MVEIRENQELLVENLFVYKGFIRQTELDAIGKEMEQELHLLGATIIGRAITATYSLNQDMMDIEVLMPIDREVASTDKFIFKKQIKIVNAIVASYKGHPLGLQDACNKLNKYIADKQMIPITVGYNVTRNVDLADLEKTEIDVYVGISPNIL